MKLESIQFKHVALFHDLKIQFQYDKQPITLILGEQATGKSMLLKHIYHALTWFPARLKDIRTPGIVMPDQDITYSRLQAKIEVSIQIPPEFGQLPESTSAQQADSSLCSWKLFKTLNASGIGISQVETQQLEQTVTLYNQVTRKDPLQGLPLLAYYPSERFINDINLLNKNLPGITQSVSAYDISYIPFTTFTRFFEWLREISDIENAQAAYVVQKIISQQSNPKNKEELLHQLQIELAGQPKQLPSPNLYALKSALKIIFPELEDLYLQYHPRLQLMVHYKGETLTFQQLSNTTKTWIALIGDVVRRLCLLNPLSLDPCLEGEGILLIDQIDSQLDALHCSEILNRLHQAFPRLQIIVTGSREELLEHAAAYQCLKLEHSKINQLDLNTTQQQLEHLYTLLQRDEVSAPLDPLPLDSEPTTAQIDNLYQQIQNLNEQQKNELLRMIHAGDTSEETSSL
ncbi:AAA family ATPase [Acinetobacter sp.]|jgi:predicted ATP-binding protein involved in virulence|uniref:AAA family ATPase n=1 Tax=Acinetobacter sp. TaxID=472 RepID=UPI00282649B6|nr:AAA family ATPase [Acinetobacter sp.]MDR2250445.1 AAA family ATPase [Acinetobacter sp.]